MQDNHTPIEDTPTKTCSKCGEIKALTEYYRDKKAKDGLYSHCKACHYKMTHAYEQTEKGKAVAARSSREQYYERGGKEKSRVINSQEKARERRREYNRTEAGKEASRRKEEKRKRESPEKLKAKAAVTHAVAKGVLPRVSTQKCRVCGEQASEYHHWSYAPEHWLDVEPRCKRCHAITYTTPYE